jgi:hypothetical protein
LEEWRKASKKTMSRVERNARIEAEKKKAARHSKVIDCAVILVFLALAFAYVSTLSVITPEPEYVFAGGKSKTVPVYSISVYSVEPDPEEAETQEAGEADQPESS